jgi:hypothetical protein
MTVGVQRHQPALAELGLADVQHTVRHNVVEPERESFRDTQAGGRDQPEQHHVELAPQWIGLLIPQIVRGIEDAGDLVRCVDIRNRAGFPAPCDVGTGDLMPSIFGVEEAREQDQIRQAPRVSIRRPGGHRQPSQNRRRPDMGLAPRGGEARVGAKMPLGFDQLVAERAAQHDVAS